MLTLTKWLHQRRGWWLAVTCVSAWVALWGIPFIVTAYRNPPDLPLPTNDEYEYLTGWTSGYGLREAAQEMLQHPERPPITALLGSCNTVRLYLPLNSTVKFNCPNVWEGSGLSDARNLVQAQAEQQTTALMLAELNGPVPESVLPTPYREIARYERPGGTYSVLLLEVTR
jgi:hypothetical protein